MSDWKKRSQELEKRYKSEYEQKTFPQQVNVIADKMDSAIEQDNGLFGMVESQLRGTGETLSKGYAQITTNPIAGAFNLAQGLGHAAFTPISLGFGLADYGLRGAGSDPILDVANTVMDLPAMAVRESFDFIERNVAGVKGTSELFGVEENTMQEIFDASKGFSELVGTLVAFKGVHKVISKIKGGKGTKAEIEQAVIEEAKTFSDNKKFQEKVTQVEAELKKTPIQTKGIELDKPKEVVQKQVVSKETVVTENVKKATKVEESIERKQDVRKDIEIEKQATKVEGGVKLKADPKLPKPRARETELKEKRTPLEKEPVAKGEITKTEAKQLVKKPKAEIPSEKPRQQPPKKKEVIVEEVVQPIEETKPKIDTGIAKPIEKQITETPHAKANRLQREVSQAQIKQINGEITKAEFDAINKRVQAEAKADRAAQAKAEEKAILEKQAEKSPIIKTDIKDIKQQKKFLQDEFSKLEVEIKGKENLGRDLEVEINGFKMKINDPTPKTIEALQSRLGLLTRKEITVGDPSGSGNEFRSQNRKIKEPGINPKGKIDKKAVEEARFGLGLGLGDIKQLKPSEIAKTIKENNQVLRDFTTVGFDYVSKGAKNFKDWSAKMIGEFSNKIKPHLLKIWKAVKDYATGQKAILSPQTLGMLGGELKKPKGKILKPSELPKEFKKTKETKPIKEVKEKQPINTFMGKIVDITKTERSKIYEENRQVQKESTKVLVRGKKAIQENTKAIKKLVKDTLEPISTSVEKISKDAFRKMKNFQFQHDVVHNKRHKILGEYLTKKHKSKMSANEALDYDLALKNGWLKDAEVIAKKYNFLDEFNKIKAEMDKLGTELGVGKKIDNYYPRMVKDFEGFVDYLKDTFPDYWKDAFSVLIEKKAQRLGRKLTTEEQATLINNALRGYNPGIKLSDVGNMRRRVIKELDGKFNQFYAHSDLALTKYIDQFTELSEARKFFGKGINDVSESVGEFIRTMREDKALSFEDAQNLTEIMKARFNQKPIQSPIIRELKNIGIVAKLAQPLGGVLTQLKDVAFSLYLAPKETLPAYIKTWGSKLTGGKIKSDISIDFVGVDPLKIAHELADGRFRTKYVNEALSKSGFTSIDMIGKETLINALYKKYTKQAKKPTTEFNRRIERFFGKGVEKTKVLNDLKLGKKSDSVAFLLYNELTGTQPITMMEVPKNYLKGGNWRVAYFLKTFTIRQLDFALNETARVMRDKSLSKKERLGGAKNLFKLMASLSVAGATVDELKGWLMSSLTGKEHKETFTENMIDNIVSMTLLSKYDYWNVSRGGLEGAIGKKILPPLDYISDPLWHDIPNLIEGKAKAIRSVKHIPIIGKFSYEYLKNKRSSSPSRSSRRVRSSRSTRKSRR